MEKHGKGNNPPKRLKVINKKRKNERKANNLLTKGNNLKKKDKNLEKDIEVIKSRMNNTKKVKISRDEKDNTKNSLIEEVNISREKDDPSGNGKIKEENIFKLNLININVSEPKKNVYIPNNSEQVLNLYEFKEAVQYDKRGLGAIYYIFLIYKQVIMYSIFYNSPLDPLPIRLSLLKLILGCDLAFNAILYTDDKVSEKYNSLKSIALFASTNNLLIILLSTLFDYIIFVILGYLINSTNELRKLFRIEEERIKNNKSYVTSISRKKEVIMEVKIILKKHKIKVIIFYVIEFLLMMGFWYYATVFCYIYQKTVISWLLDSLITIILRIIIDVIKNFIYSALYKCSITYNCEGIYKLIIFQYSFYY